MGRNSIGDVIKGTVVIQPKKLVDTEEVLTPAQQAVIDARLAAGLEDIKQGRVLGPFDTAKEAMQALRAKTRR